MEELKNTGQEKLTSASDLAAKLEITLQMLAVYVKAYSKVTKVQIQKVGRKGRYFDPLQVQIFTNARDIVRTNSGVSVEEAMKRALVFNSEALERAAEGVETRNADAALTAALRREVAGPIVEELQALRREMAELKEAQMAKVEKRLVEKKIEEKLTWEESPSIEANAKPEKVGSFTNLGTFLERFLGRFRRP